MALQEDEIVQLFDAAYANMSAHRVLDVRSQSLMSWSKEAAKLNMSAHANAAGRDELGRGESNTIAEARGGTHLWFSSRCSCPSCRSAGRRRPRQGTCLHTQTRRGATSWDEGSQTRLQGAGMDALSVLVTLLMFQLLSGWLKALAPANIAAHAHTRRKHGERRPGEGAKRAAEARGRTHCRFSSRCSCPSC